MDVRPEHMPSMLWEILLQALRLQDLIKSEMVPITQLPSISTMDQPSSSGALSSRLTRTPAAAVSVSRAIAFAISSIACLARSAAEWP